MQVVTVDPTEPREDRLVAAVSVIDAGGVVALPTETFYGLAADALNAEALVRLNMLKDKPADSPILLLLAEPSQVETVAASVPEIFHELTQLFWPGPLTLVVPAADRVPREVTGGRGTVAVRVPGLTLPRRIARKLGRPITGPSANLHGEPSVPHRRRGRRGIRRRAGHGARRGPDRGRQALDDCGFDRRSTAPAARGPAPGDVAGAVPSRSDLLKPLVPGRETRFAVALWPRTAVPPAVGVCPYLSV